MLEKEAMEKATTNTMSLMLAQNSEREPLYTKDLKYGTG